MLKNLWYQPVNLTDGSLINIEAQPRSGELAILSLSHSQMTQNSDVDMLANMIDHYVGGLVVPSDQGLYEVDQTPLKEYTARGHNLLIFLGPETGGGVDDVTKYAYETYPHLFWSTDDNEYRTWHDESRLGEVYYQKIHDAIVGRTEESDKIHVIQYHLTDILKYESTLNFNKEYDGISDTFLLSQKEYLLDHNVNVIESNALTQFSIQFPILLNYEGAKFEIKEHVNTEPEEE